MAPSEEELRKPLTPEDPPGGGWSGQLPALKLSLETVPRGSKVGGAAFTLSAPGSLHLGGGGGAVRCGAGSCDPDASPLVHVGWGHTCGDACPHGSLLPS